MAKRNTRTVRLVEDRGYIKIEMEMEYGQRDYIVRTPKGVIAVRSSLVEAQVVANSLGYELAKEAGNE